MGILASATTAPGHLFALLPPVRAVRRRGGDVGLGDSYHHNRISSEELARSPHRQGFPALRNALGQVTRWLAGPFVIGDGKPLEIDITEAEIADQLWGRMS